MLAKRSLIRTQTEAELAAWLAANPGAVQQTFGVRPSSFPARPVIYVGGVRLTHTTDQQLNTIGEAEVVIVGSAIDNAEGVEEVEAIADSLTEWFSDRAHYVNPNTVAEPTGSENAAVSVGDAHYHGLTLTIGNILFVEGRS